MTKQDMSGLSDPIMVFGGNPDAALEELKDHLLTAPHSVWLDVVRRSNRGQHYDLLNWIIEQPECDQTLAQLVFFQCEPEQMLERRITIDPEYPERNAICRTVAVNFAGGQYQERLAGLIPGELDKRIAALDVVLADIAPDERVFDVPVPFLSAPDVQAAPIDPAWDAQEDEHVRLLYQANNLMVIAGMESPDQSDEASGAVSVIESLLSILRGPKN